MHIMTDFRYIGLKIKKLRNRQKISQERLAEMTDTNYRTVLRIENGHSLPTLDTLAKIAKALNCNIIDFFENDGIIKTREEMMIDIINDLNDLSDEDLKKFYIGFCCV